GSVSGHKWKISSSRMEVIFFKLAETFLVEALSFPSRVGTAVARRPLFRSGRAALPHPAPTLGDDAQAHEWIGVANAGGREPTGNEPVHSRPGHASALTAAFEDPLPDASDRESEGRDRLAVEWHSIVPHVPRHHRPQVGPQFRHRRMHASPKLGFDLL